MLIMVKLLVTWFVLSMCVGASHNLTRNADLAYGLKCIAGISLLFWIPTTVITGLTALWIYI